MLKYRYLQLKPGYIRVIHLSRAANGQSYQGHSQHVNIETGIFSPTPKYVALSYTWGDETQTYPFTCDGQNLPVRANLRDALQRIGDLLDGLPIWIDAICINQADESEKSAQIRMMPSIYKTARKVLIWLGEDIDITARTIDRIPEYTARLGATPTGSGSAPPLDPDPEFRRGVEDLILRPWWARLWVLQEACLARSAIFVCGPCQVEWRVLRSLTKQIANHGLQALFRGSSRRPTYCDGLQELLNVEVLKHRHDVALPSNLLMVCRQRICSDPRDRVNALIGLTPQFLLQTHDWKPASSIEDLYTEFAAMLISLDIFGVLLSLKETAFRRPGLPSWVPDFHERAEAIILADEESYHAGFNVHSGAAVALNSENWRQIKIPAIKADRVTFVVEGGWADVLVQEDYPALVKCATQNLEWLVACQKAISEAGSKGNGRSLSSAEDLWRVFIGDKTAEEKSPLHLLSGFGNLHDALSKRVWKDQEAAMLRAYDNLCSLLDRIVSGGEGSETPALLTRGTEMFRYLDKMNSVCGHRRFFVTEQGRAGLGPQDLTPGDEIFVFKGFKIPFALRQAAGNQSASADQLVLNLLGEVYLHGLMKGEALKNRSKPVFNEVILG